MFADPQVVTTNSVARTMPKIHATKTTGFYSDPTGLYRLEIRQTPTANRFQREVRLHYKTVAADPLTAVQKEQTCTVSLVINEPKWGFDDTTLGYLVSGLIGWLQASSGANQTKLLGGEM